MLTNGEAELREAARDLARSDEPALARVGRRIETRRCGPCRLCCTVKTIADYRPEPKPAGVACPSLCGRGCATYATRPDSCREYLCAWRGGLGGSAARPDRCGVLVDLHVLGNDEPSLTVQATRGGFDPRPVAEMIEDAWAAGIRHVAFAGERDDLDRALFRYEGDPRRIAAGLAAFSRDGVAPPGFVLPPPVADGGGLDGAPASRSAGAPEGEAGPGHEAPRPAEPIATGGEEGRR